MKGRRSKSGQHRKVDEARRVVAEALGDQLPREVPENVAKYVPIKPVEPVQARSEAIGVLFLGEVAARLGITRGEVERLTASGKLRALPTGYTVMVPSSEVERAIAPASPTCAAR